MFTLSKVIGVDCRRRIKIYCLIATSTILFIYVMILEPHCFFRRSVYGNDIAKFADSKIEFYGSSELSLDKKNIIVMMIPRMTSKLTRRLQLLDVNFDDKFETDMLFLYTDSLFRNDFIRLTKAMKRRVLFLNIARVFNIFPIGFDTCKTATPYRVRGKWNYLLMIRFWFKSLFELPQLRQYEYIMRLDDDSKLTGRWFNVFNEMREKDAVYFANNVDVDLEDQLPGTMLMQQVTIDYIKQNKIKPKQSDLLNNAFFNKTVLNYYNNFEVLKMEFFRRDEVRHWIDAIDETYGIFKHRWGDAVLRYLTMAIFAEQNQVLHRSDYNLSYCHKCP